MAPAEQVNLATGSVTYLVTDSLGSVRGVVSSTGTLTVTMSYDAWGNLEATGGLTVSTRYGYAGGYTDATGLVYLINRYYDPATGQFISVHPDVSQTLTPYAYANDDPVLNSGPAGLSAYEPVCDVGWRVKVCIEDVATWYNDDWNAVATFQPVSGQIQKIAASSIGMNVCGEGSRPKTSNACSRAGVVNNPSEMPVLAIVDQFDAGLTLARLRLRPPRSPPGLGWVQHAPNNIITATHRKKGK
jgi:RHS repeat-associated protein